MHNLAPNNAYGLELRNPIIVAAGCWGFGSEAARLADLGSIGAIVTASISLRPRRPAAEPRLVESPAGLLWAGGTANPGAEAVLRRYGDGWATSPCPIIVSLVGSSAEEYAALAEGLEGLEGIAGIEACLPPDQGQATQALRALRAATSLPLLAKLPPLDGNLLTLATALATAGADALVLSGMRPGLAPLLDGRQARGMLCGPALRPLALLALAELAGQVALPIVAGGGVATTADAQALLALGASAVLVGSAALVDPTVPERIARELP